MSQRAWASSPSKLLRSSAPWRRRAGRRDAGRRASTGRFLVSRVAAVPTITVRTPARRPAHRGTCRSTGVCRPAIAPARLMAARQRTTCRGGSSPPPAHYVKRSGANPDRRPVPFPSQSLSRLGRRRSARGLVEARNASASPQRASLARRSAGGIAANHARLRTEARSTTISSGSVTRAAKSIGDDCRSWDTTDLPAPTLAPLVLDSRPCGLTQALNMPLRALSAACIGSNTPPHTTQIR